MCDNLIPPLLEILHVLYPGTTFTRDTEYSYNMCHQNLGSCCEITINDKGDGSNNWCSDTITLYCGGFMDRGINNIPSRFTPCVDEYEQLEYIHYIVGVISKDYRGYVGNITPIRKKNHEIAGIL